MNKVPSETYDAPEWAPRLVNGEKWLSPREEELLTVPQSDLDALLCAQSGGGGAVQKWFELRNDWKREMRAVKRQAIEKKMQKLEHAVPIERRLSVAEEMRRRRF